ncbi:MAG: hypothetical protein RLZZ450_6024 [Pseudomonadota bacterium]|jgi:hypothetical protein
MTVVLASAMTAACPRMEPSQHHADAAHDVVDATGEADGSRPPSVPDAEGRRSPATHTGLVSVQDITIANLPASGHGLTVNAFLTQAVAPDYEEHPGQVTGCRAWAYDRVDKPPATQEDHGVLNIAGVENGPLACAFSSERGAYWCPAIGERAAAASASVSVVHESGVTLSLVPDGDSAFDGVEATLTPGAAFNLDSATNATLQNLPLRGDAVSLSCRECGAAEVTIVRITSSDGDLTGSSPVAMPAPKQKSVEIQCVALGSSTIVVPAAAMQLLAETHRLSPATRVRTAFMRDGLRVVTNQPPRAPNQLVLAVGHGVLGFTTPQGASTTSAHTEQPRASTPAP